jgi:hypothetical protein
LFIRYQTIRPPISPLLHRTCVSVAGDNAFMLKSQATRMGSAMLVIEVECSAALAQPAACLASGDSDSFS